MDEDQIIERAISAYIRTCKQASPIFNTPARRSCRINEHEGALYAVIANGCGGPEDTLAVYRVHGDPHGTYRLQGLREWPDEVVAS